MSLGAQRRHELHGRTTATTLRRAPRLKKAAAKVLGSTWQKCRVHYVRNARALPGDGYQQSREDDTAGRDGLHRACQSWSLRITSTP
jgi:hypothetical protein